MYIVIDIYIILDGLECDTTHTRINCLNESNIFLYHTKTKPYNIIIIFYISLTSEITKFDLLFVLLCFRVISI